MATNISLVTYAGQTVTPLDDALIYEKAITNGIIDGCECTLSGGNTIHMEGGHGVICGRKFTVYESDTNIPLSSSGTLYGRMKVHLDLSDTGEPIQFVVESAASLPALTQDDDVNVNNGIYEFVMCTFTVSETTVSDFVQAFPTAYAADRSLASMDAQAAPLSSTDMILIERADGTKKSMTYTELINAISNQVINRTFNSSALANYLKNNGTTTASGYALDAKYGKTLQDAIDSLNSNIPTTYGTGTYSSNTFFGVSGFVTTSSTVLNLFVPMSISNAISGVTVSSFVIQVRTADGYFVIASNTDISSYLTSYSVRTRQGGINFVFTSSSGWTDSSSSTITNNTIVGGVVVITMTLS